MLYKTTSTVWQWERVHWLRKWQNIFISATTFRIVVGRRRFPAVCSHLNVVDVRERIVCTIAFVASSAHERFTNVWALCTTYLAQSLLHFRFILPRHSSFIFFFLVIFISFYSFHFSISTFANAFFVRSRTSNAGSSPSFSFNFLLIIFIILHVCECHVVFGCRRNW